MATKQNKRSDSSDERKLQDISIGLENLGMALMEIAHNVRKPSMGDYIGDELERLQNVHSLVAYYGKTLRQLCGQMKPTELPRDTE